MGSSTYCHNNSLRVLAQGVQQDILMGLIVDVVILIDVDLRGQRGDEHSWRLLLCQGATDKVLNTIFIVIWTKLV